MDFFFQNAVECSKFVQSLSQSTLCTELCAGVIIIQFDSMVELPSGVTLNQDRLYKCQRTPGLYVYNMHIYIDIDIDIDRLIRPQRYPFLFS